MKSIDTAIYTYFTAEGAPLKGMDSVYGSGHGPIILDNVVCNGSEDHLLLCAHNDFFVTNCDHSEDAAVVCEGKRTVSGKWRFLMTMSISVPCLDGAVRLMNEESDLVGLEPVSEFIKDELSRGRVEVCVGSSFGTVCDEEWDNMDASVVCGQSGFSQYGKFLGHYNTSYVSMEFMLESSQW